MTYRGLKKFVQFPLLSQPTAFPSRTHLANLRLNPGFPAPCDVSCSLRSSRFYGHAKISDVCLYVQESDGTKGRTSLPHTQRDQSSTDPLRTRISVSRGCTRPADDLQVARAFATGKPSPPMIKGPAVLEERLWPRQFLPC
jgi:hypothetical protein